MKRDILREELLKEDPNQSKLRALAGGILAMQGRLVNNRIDYMFKLHDLLTPDQGHKLHAMRLEGQALLRSQNEQRGQLLKKEKKGKKSAAALISGSSTLKEESPGDHRKQK